MTNEHLSLFDAIYSQRAIRHFSAHPVSVEVVETLLNAAIRAPSGGNRQPWRFLVIRDAAIKRQLGQWYLAAWQRSLVWRRSPNLTGTGRNSRSRWLPCPC